MFAKHSAQACHLHAHTEMQGIEIEEAAARRHQVGRRHKQYSMKELSGKICHGCFPLTARSTTGDSNRTNTGEPPMTKAQSA